LAKDTAIAKIDHDQRYCRQYLRKKIVRNAGKKAPNQTIFAECEKKISIFVDTTEK